jgi:uncharacterized protein
MQSIISKGKDVEEAISIGLTLLKVKQDEVNIEIIRSATKGFLGIGSKDAIVKLSISSNTSKSINAVDLLEQELKKRESDNYEKAKGISPASHNELEGKVWVENGQLYCMSSLTFYPTAAIGEGIKLRQNGEWVKESIVVLSDNALYEIVVNDEEKPTNWEISIDRAKFKVILSVDPGYKKRRYIPDIEPESHITLKAEEIKEVNNTLSYEDVMKRLEALRVRHGFNQDNILKAIEAVEPGKFEIATGMPPKKGQDGRLELKVETKMKREYCEDEFGNINFKDIFTIPSVDRGQVITITHPPIPGKPGLTVTNEPLPPEQTFPIELKLGRGVMVVDNKVVATESGRPKVKQKGRMVNISILPKLIHKGDVDLQSGNLRFSGDIEIYGEVKDNMAVEADGDILVHSTVSFATVTAKGVIVTTKNVVSSELSAGKSNMLVTECGHTLGIIHQQIEQMIAFIKNLIGSPVFKQADISQKGLQPLIKILIENRFKSIVPPSKKYVEVVLTGKDYFASDDWRNIATALRQIFLSLSNEIITFDRMKELSEKMKTLHEMSKLPSDQESNIILSNALNSKLYSSGDISIIGQSCVNTKVHSGGMLKVKGIVRGGELYAKQGMEVNEVGSEMGTPTILAVPADQKINIIKAMTGTIIKIGTIAYSFDDTRYHVCAFVNSDGRITF